jgi:mono/diheme cytochrome c family protein
MSRRGAASALFVVCVGSSVLGAAQEFSLEQIRRGAGIYDQNCAPCHGARMLDPNSAFDLRKFPPDEKNRFVRSVTKGLNSMPPWGDLLKADDIEALWAYVSAGEQ